jgi:LEA14-like dessication related protein
MYKLLPKLIHLSSAAASAFLIVFMLGCQAPEEDIKLVDIRDVVLAASSDPTLRANAVFFNPNRVRGRLKKIDVEIYVNGKKAATVDQTLKTAIPANAEFTVPLEVKLALKEMGFMDTLFGMLGGKKFDIHYKGSLRLNYRGLPIRVPVDHKDQVRIRL